VTEAVTAAVALRALHFAAAAALFGEFVFALAIERPDAAAWRRLARVAAWALALLVASGALWFVVEAMAMSGAPLREALSRETLGAVLGETLYGRVSMLRLGLAAVLGVLLLALWRARPAQVAVGVAMRVAGVVLSGALLASIAWMGHAAAEEGVDRVVHLSSYALHLLAAGAWVGALWPLAVALARSADPARAAHRFSALGIASVATLVVTGVANSWYTVGSLPAMIGTEYGRRLSAKLLLFAAMLALAAVNRLRLTPRLAEGDAAALARLRRNAAIEAALGLGVIAVVGALGVTVPALHVQTTWPFAHTIEVPEGAEALVGALFVAPLFALGLVVAGVQARRRALVSAGGVMVAAALAGGVWLCAAPAVPTTYFHSTVRYAADSIARGADVYGARCAVCHGARGRGDGPAAASLPQRPPDLAAHWSHHREGDLYWWVEHGIPGTAMPAFAETIPERGAWDVLNFLRAQADAADADVLGAAVQPGIGLAAPDFPFQVGTRPQESLGELRGRSMVLLVFYELPGSLARLRALAEVGIHFGHVGVRVIAFPVRGRAAKPGAEGDADMLADPDPSVVNTYALFAPGAAARPVEYLVDRQGDIRARWVPGATPDWSAMPALFAQIDTLDREPPRPLRRARHVH